MKAKTILSIFLICLFLCSLVSAKGFKGKIKKLKNKLDNASNNVNEKAKKAINEASNVTEKLKKRVDESMVAKIDKWSKDLKAKLDHLKNDDSEEANRERQEIIAKAKKQLEFEIYKDLRTNSLDLVTKDIFGKEVDPEELKKMLDESDLPEILKKFGDKIGEDIDPDTINWNLPKDAEKRIAQVLDESKKEIGKELDTEIDKIAQEMAKAKPNEEIVQQATQKLTTTVKEKIVEDEKTQQAIEQIQQNANKFKKDAMDKFNETSQFEVQEFRDEVKDIVDNVKNEYEEMTLQEKKDLDDLMLATNQNLNTLLKNVQDEKIKDRIVKRMRQETSELMKNNNRNYDDITKKISEKVDEINNDQYKHIKDNSIKLSTPYPLFPKQPYTFSVQDVMDEQRSDIDFFEFQTVSLPSGVELYDENGQQEGFVAVTPETISGVAFGAEGTYTFDVGLKYTSLLQDNTSKIYDTKMTMEVSKTAGLKSSSGSSSMERNLLIACAILGILSLTLIIYQVYSRCSSKRVLRYEDMGSEVGDSNHHGHIGRATGFEIA